MNRKSILIGAISFFIAGFGSLIIRTGLEKRVVDFRDEYDVSSSVATIPFSLKDLSDHYLRVKFAFEDTAAHSVSLNTNELELKTGNKSDNIVTSNYYLPRKVLRLGNNNLIFRFYGIAPKSLDIRFKNYIFSDGKYIFLVTRNSGLFTDRKIPVMFIWAFVFIYILLLWIILMEFQGKVLLLKKDESLFNALLIFAPIGISLFLVSVLSWIGPYSIVIDPVFFAIGIFISVLIGFLSLSGLRFVAKFKGVDWRSFLKKTINTLEVSNLFLILFMIMFCCALFLHVFGLEDKIKFFAKKAYQLLIITVLIKTVKFLWLNNDQKKT